MRYAIYISIVAFAMGIGSAWWSIANTQKLAFVSSARLFESFDGTKEMARRLDGMRTSHRKALDSLATAVELLKAQDSGYGEGVARYRKAEQLFAEEDAEKSSLYTEQLWKQINQYVQSYGKEQGYSYIFGATGNGTIMYAPEGDDITDEAIEYINHKYAGHD